MPYRAAGDRWGRLGIVGQGGGGGWEGVMVCGCVGRDLTGVGKGLKVKGWGMGVGG